MKLQNKNYVISTIFGLIALALIIFLIYPSFNDVKKNSQELFTAKKELILLDAQIRELENFDDNYTSYQPNLEKTNQLFVDSKNPIGFIQFLETIASDFEITIEISLLFPLKKESKIEPWSNITFQVSSKGIFSNFLKFFEQLEQSQYLIEAQNLTIRRLSDRELGMEEKYSLGDINAVFLMKVFAK